MNTINPTIEKLGQAVEIVEQRFGKGSAERNAPIVAAVLYCIAAEAQGEKFADELEKLGSTIAQSAAVAAGS